MKYSIIFFAFFYFINSHLFADNKIVLTNENCKIESVKVSKIIGLERVGVNQNGNWLTTMILEEDGRYIKREYHGSAKIIANELKGLGRQMYKVHNGTYFYLEKIPNGIKLRTNSYLYSSYSRGLGLPDGDYLKNLNRTGIIEIDRLLKLKVSKRMLPQVKEKFVNQGYHGKRIKPLPKSVFSPSSSYVAMNEKNKKNIIKGKKYSSRLAKGVLKGNVIAGILMVTMEMKENESNYLNNWSQGDSYDSFCKAIEIISKCESSQSLSENCYFSKEEHDKVLRRMLNEGYGYEEVFTKL